jgi:hypothetical protein
MQAYLGDNRVAHLHIENFLSFVHLGCLHLLLRRGVATAIGSIALLKFADPLARSGQPSLFHAILNF